MHWKKIFKTWFSKTFDIYLRCISKEYKALNVYPRVPQKCAYWDNCKWRDTQTDQIQHPPDIFLQSNMHLHIPTSVLIVPWEFPVRCHWAGRSFRRSSWDRWRQMSNDHKLSTHLSLFNSGRSFATNSLPYCCTRSELDNGLSNASKKADQLNHVQGGCGTNTVKKRNFSFTVFLAPPFFCPRNCFLPLFLKVCVRKFWRICFTSSVSNPQVLGCLNIPDSCFIPLQREPCLMPIALYFIWPIQEED